MQLIMKDKNILLWKKYTNLIYIYVYIYVNITCYEDRKSTTLGKSTDFNGNWSTLFAKR